MTKVQTIDRDLHAREVIGEVIGDLIKEPRPVNWNVTARNNYSDEPSFYVRIEMPAQNDIPSIATQNQLVAEMRTALERIDDDRFPYVYFGPFEEQSGEKSRESRPSRPQL